MGLNTCPSELDTRIIVNPMLSMAVAGGSQNKLIRNISAFVVLTVEA